MFFAGRWAHFEGIQKLCQVFFLCSFPLANNSAVGLSITLPSDRIGTSIYSPEYPFAQMVFLPDGRVIAGTDDWNGFYQIKIFSAALVVDPGFTMVGAGPFAVQPDGKLIARGRGSKPDANGRTECLIRFSVDGTLDTSFNPPRLREGALFHDFNRIVVQPDGKILLAVRQSNIDPEGFNRLASGLTRLNPDGSFDDTFQYTSDFSSSEITHVLLYPDGKILINGARSHDGQVAGVARLNPNGSRDFTFSPNVHSAYDLALLPDLKIIVGGYYEEGNLRMLRRLHPNGEADGSFAVDQSAFPANEFGARVAFQPDGRLVAFTSFGRMLRFLPSGELDGTFRPDVGQSGADSTDLQIDERSRIYLVRNEIIQQFSGQFRLRATADAIPLILEGAIGLAPNYFWMFAANVPANQTIEHVSPDFPQAGTQFFRLRPNE